MIKLPPNRPLYCLYVVCANLNYANMSKYCVKTFGSNFVPTKKLKKSRKKVLLDFNGIIFIICQDRKSNWRGESRAQPSNIHCRALPGIGLTLKKCRFD